jgi:membrane protease subunit HflK
MERILGSAEKLVYDGGNSSSGQGSGQNIVPYLPLSELSPRRQAAPAAGQPQQQSGATR